MAVTFYICLKKGNHETPPENEMVEKFEINMDFGRALKLWRVVVESFKRSVKLESIYE